MLNAILDNNSEYYKALLTAIYPCKVPFTVVVKDDKPKKRLGTYYGKTHRIILHLGWASKYNPIEIAIHEYAHHINDTEFNSAKKKNAPHGKEFWQIYGQLMNRAKALGIYESESCPVLSFPDTIPAEELQSKEGSDYGEVVENQFSKTGLPSFKQVLKDLITKWNR